MEATEIIQDATSSKHKKPGKKDKSLCTTNEKQAIVSSPQPTKRKRVSLNVNANVKEVPSGDSVDAGEGEADMAYSEFAVLGTETFEELKPIKYVPEWIKNAVPVSSDLSQDKSPVADLKGLDERLVQTLLKQNIMHFFPVQKAVIPELLREVLRPHPLAQPRDVCVSAATGSGKTLCYVLPIIQALSVPSLLSNGIVDPLKKIQALVMLPVKELAQQVYSVFQHYCHGFDLRVVLVTGLADLRSENASLYQRRADGSLHCTADIVVATPGRLLDHLHVHNTAFVLKHLRYLVIDEADRMMAETKLDWLPEVEDAVYGFRNQERQRPGIVSFRRLGSIKRPLQKILLSATLSHDPERLHQWNLFLPKLFSARSDPQLLPGTISTDVAEADSSMLGHVALPPELSEAFIKVNSNQRPLFVHHLLHENKQQWQRVLCFTNSRRSCHRLALLLRMLGNTDVKEFSADLPSHKRNRMLRQLKSGFIRVLVSSDVLARGIDVVNVDCVINYDPPTQFKAYVHRIGRTARAGQPGSTITLLSDEETELFTKMLRAAGHSADGMAENTVLECDLEKYLDHYKTCLKQLQEQLQEHEKKTKRNTEKSKKEKKNAGS